MRVPSYRVLASRVANLMAENEPASTNSEFMAALNAELAHFNLTIEAHQQGIRGTYLRVVRVQS